MADVGNAVTQELLEKKCVPCEGGVQPLAADAIQKLLKGTPGWSLTADGKAIRRQWKVKDFLTALDFFQRIGAIAEAEDHHPDLHLTGYRQVAIEMTTHALGGLSENDFILAAKINAVPVELKG
ncbi:MAG TPA: 4a-hydroxytetrahydrobiopterin dehydratase [Gemmatales bacterium]|nr:4a-hydroxytetrahydrobiopterin dehydratase [Gemmatales bacterium]HMP57786.1 4a-hydroxytetrahydrobiopterin dehydratase [Gemmatales bacterium]